MRDRGRGAARVAMEYPAKFRSLHLVHWGAPWPSRAAPPPPATLGLSGADLVLAASRARCLMGGAAGRFGSTGAVGAVDCRAGQAPCSGGAGVAGSYAASSRKRITVPHADEAGMEDDGLNYMGHMLAGSIAGMSEHAFMFPADTVKTRMQVGSRLRSKLLLFS